MYYWAATVLILVVFYQIARSGGKVEALPYVWFGFWWVRITNLNPQERH